MRPLGVILRTCWTGFPASELGAGSPVQGPGVPAGIWAARTRPGPWAESCSTRYPDSAEAALLQAEIEGE